MVLWWQDHGQRDYPDENEVLIMCDGGGSNIPSSYLFKEDFKSCPIFQDWFVKWKSYF
ncbi:hypothetical protein [Endozoicomonas sp. ONNA2]|uniref:ISAzo13-like element transposase-related protein n=1 Tax=Endozoicomonas sp. ONNA2 TaxID=2828741 RepID=UPI0035A11206